MPILYTQHMQADSSVPCDVIGRYTQVKVIYDVTSTILVFFFFSSRRRHTRCSRDWSSDVCSSDLAPIWADFMTKATSISPYRDVKDFSMPDGVQSVVIDPESLQLATPNCPTTREEVYVAGSAPTDFCELHGGDRTGTPPRSGPSPNSNGKAH